jgi:methionyl-tRNA formyltransferase
MSIVFVGTPEFAVPSLRRIVADGHEVAAVITQPDRATGRHRNRLTPPPVKEAALELGLAVRQPASLRDPEAVAELRSLNPEVMIVVAYGQILRQDVLDIPTRGVLNVHASLLPKYRGASPIAAAILAGDDETGVSIMLMDAGMDTGPLLSQRREATSPHDTTGSLSERLSHLGADLLGETLPSWLAGEIEPQPQVNAQATVTRLIHKKDGAIDWTLPAAEIWRRVRAYNPWPGANTALDGEQITIWQSWPLDTQSSQPPGTVITLPSDAPNVAHHAAFAVAAGAGSLEIIELQRSGRRTITGNEFLRGTPGLMGKRFETLGK